LTFDLITLTFDLRPVSGVTGHRFPPASVHLATRYALPSILDLGSGKGQTDSQKTAVTALCPTLWRRGGIIIIQDKSLCWRRAAAAGMVLHSVERRRVGCVGVERPYDPAVAGRRRDASGGDRRRRRRVPRPGERRPAHGGGPGGPTARPQAGHVTGGPRRAGEV